MINEIISNIFRKTNNPSDLLTVKYLNDLKYFSAAKKIFLSLENYSADYKLMFVGGCVRKLLKEEEVDDMDIATNINPKKVKEILKEKNIKFIETGIEHGTVSVFINDFKFELTTLRKDLSTDGRHANVEFISDWEVDAKRRDFTINSIYSDLSGKIFDPLGGVADLRKGIVKFIGDAEQRIKEDYIRILRYIRFFTQYSNYEHKQNTVDAIKKNLGNFNKISKERSLDELFKILKLKNLNNLFDNEFSRFVILSIFPQFKYFDRLKSLNKISKHLQPRINKILLLSILIIDNSDNCDFFLYKFNLSNQIKKRILFIKTSFASNYIGDLLNKKNLIKLCYDNNKKEDVIDLLIFLIFNYPQKLKIIENLIEFIDNSAIPEFPIQAEYLIKQFNFTEGKKLGDALKKLESIWIKNNFKIDKDKINSILEI